jgi:hypothetical protein
MKNSFVLDKGGSPIGAAQGLPGGMPRGGCSGENEGLSGDPSVGTRG